MTVWTPHDYQKKCVKHVLAEPGSGLLLDPGLGKTSIVLQAVSVLLDKSVIDAVLVVAPLRVCHEVWPAEVEKWDQFNDLSVGVLHGPKKGEVLNEAHDIYVINPEGLTWLTKQKWDWPMMLVVDESTKFKNTRSARWKMLREKLNAFERRVILTGTPTPNGLADLFGQVFIVDGGKRLGRSFFRYRNTYFTQTGFGGYTWLAKPDAVERVNEKVGDVCLRMEASDYLDMPDMIVNDVVVPLPKKAWEVYSQLDAVYFDQVGNGEVTVANAAVLSGKLRQVVSGAVYDDDGDWQHVHDAKLVALEDLLEEIGAPVLVAYEFQHEKERISEMLEQTKRRYAILGQGVTKKQTSEAIREWNAGRLDVLLCHPASAGHGLNLQEGGHHIAWFGLTWNLEHYDQLNARLWRQGQELPVFVYHLVARKTVDERVAEALKQKDHTQKKLLTMLKRGVK